jgi:hypothetical protein
MGVDGSTRKKKHDKAKFAPAYRYYFDNSEYLLQMKENRCVIFDGAIPLEEAISIKSGNGREIVNFIFKQHIDPFLLASRKVPVIVYILDLSYRPPIKDVDVSRSYDPNADLFRCVSDERFPSREDVRDKTLLRIVKELSKHKTKLEKVRTHLKKIKTGRILKRGSSSKESLLKDKIDLNFKIRILEGQASKLRKDKMETPLDVWSAGKGNPENRKMVYQYLTKKFIDNIRQKLVPGQVFILDGVVKTKQQREVYKLNPEFEFFALKIIKKVVCGKDGKEVKKMVYTFEPGYQMGEGEQGLVYYVKKLKGLGFDNTLVYTTDTDVFAYFALNWEYLRGANDSLSVYLRFNHFYKGKLPNDPQKNDSKMYICDFPMICKMIEGMYPHLHNPIATRYLFFILLGCDFIKGVHKLIQQYCSFYGRTKDGRDVKGVVETDRLLDYLFNFRLKFQTEKKYKNPPINRREDHTQRKINEIFKLKFFDIIPINGGAYKNNTYYRVEVNVRTILNTFTYYRKKYGIKSFTREEKQKLVAICLNTNYVAEYFMNQHRIVNPLFRKKYINCDMTDKEGCHIYGYKRSEENGKIVQSLNVPKKYLMFI